jgi:hypothetical protein
MAWSCCEEASFAAVESGLIEEASFAAVESGLIEEIFLQRSRAK